jgi:hypothetical protein
MWKNIDVPSKIQVMVWRLLSYNIWSITNEWIGVQKVKHNVGVHHFFVHGGLLLGRCLEIKGSNIINVEVHYFFMYGGLLLVFCNSV